MEKFRKKPVVIEAIQWTGNNLKEIIEFTGLHESAKKWSWEEYEKVVAEDGLKIFTLEGKMNAGVNDWIIKGVKGEFYPCKSDIFEATYESADLTEIESSSGLYEKGFKQALMDVKNFGFEKVYEHHKKESIFDFSRPYWLPETGVANVRDLWNLPNDGTNPRVRAIRLIQNYAKANGHIIDIQEAAEIREKYCK